MALTKAEIIEVIQERNGLSRRSSSDRVEVLLELMKRTLERGEDLLISGFGRFSVRNKNERRGRNPATGDAIMLDSRKVVTFSCSHVLRERINSGS